MEWSNVAKTPNLRGIKRFGMARTWGGYVAYNKESKGEVKNKNKNWEKNYEEKGRGREGRVLELWERGGSSSSSSSTFQEDEVFDGERDPIHE